MRRRVLIAAGGAAGAALRWALVERFGGTGGFPTVVFAVNVAGSFLLGVVLAEEVSHLARREVLRDSLAIGFCGGLTTFSTFAVEVAAFARDGRGVLAATYACASVVAAIAAVVAGAAAGRNVGALTERVEGV